MDGILLVDKPNDMTSFDVIRQLRKTLGIKKIGHAGTLDPFATGLLVILIGKATKLSNYLLSNDKTYETVFTFGKHTDTYDITGNVLRKTDFIPSLQEIENILPTLKTYEQEPPMYSAIKLNGQKLVDLARKGKEVSRKKRLVEIKSYHIEAYDPPHLTLSLQVSKGTYIRSIAVDLATHAKSFAYVSSLRRIRSGDYHVEDASLLANIQPSDVISIEKVLDHYPKISVSPFIASKVKHGMMLDQRQYDDEGPFCVYDEKGEFIGFYEKHEKQTFKPILTMTHETH